MEHFPHMSMEHVPFTQRIKMDHRPHMDDLRFRLKQRLSQLNKSMRAASIDAGLSPEAISKILSKPEHSQTLDTIEKLAIGLQTTAQWLAFGTDGSPSETGTLRLMGEVAAGVWHEAESQSGSAGRSIRILPDPRFPADAQFALEARGTSMNRIIEPGDYVHCLEVARSGRTSSSGDIVVIERRRASGEHEISAKRQIFKDGGWQFIAESTDPSWADFALPFQANETDQVVVKAIVIGLHREFRR